MKHPTSSTSTPSANSLCRQVGHEWDPDTISANYRRCCRSQCTAAEHLVKGAWVAVTVRAHQRPTTAGQQQGTLFALDRLPTRDEERRAEQRYYRLLGR